MNPARHLGRHAVIDYERPRQLHPFNPPETVFDVQNPRGEAPQIGDVVFLVPEPETFQ